MKFIRLVLCSVVAAAGLALPAADFTIARGGSAAVPVVVPKGASKSVRHAADELAKYLGKMSGATFTVREGDWKGAAIRVGDPCPGLKAEGIRLKAGKGSLLVTGEGPRGPLYAVYALLERLGCGFWSPTNETVPQRRDIAVPASLDVTESPDFEVRDPSGISMWGSPEWRVKCAVNAGAFNSNRQGEELGGFLQYDLSQNKMGLEVDRQAFAAHPEWYALRPGGTRSMQHLCNVNLGVRQEILRRIRERMKERPDLRQVALGLNDGYEFCTCATCDRMRKEDGRQTVLEVDLANWVAGQLAAEFPKLRYLVFAYEKTLHPPKRLKPHPAVDVCVACLEYRNFARPPSVTKGYYDSLREWGELTANNVYVWSYNAQWTNFIAPWPTVDLLGDETREYRDLGVRGVFWQMSDGTISDFCDLRAWLAAKLLWNASQDEMALMEKWCRGACGAGGAKVFEWLKVCKAARLRLKSLGAYQGGTRSILTADETLRGEELLAAAEAATKGDARTHDQVRKIRASTLMAMLCRYNADLAAEARKRGVKIPTRVEILADLDARAKEFRCGTSREGWDWNYGFIRRIRHGEVEPEKLGDGPRTRGRWTFRNPVVEGSDEDTSVLHDPEGGVYYRVRTLGSEIRLRRAKRAVALFDADCEETVAWKAGAKAGITGGLRGAELVRDAKGAWRIYASGATPSGGLGLFALEAGRKPFGEYRFAGRLLEKENAADPTVFRMPDGKDYLFYAHEPGAKGGIVVRTLSAPSRPGAHEGVLVPAAAAADAADSPALVQMGKETYLLYGAGGRDSATSEIRALRYVGGDPLKAKSWEKCSKPVMVSGNVFGNENVALFGPRAPSVFRSSDGTEAWIAFRGWNKKVPGNKTKDAITCIQRLDDGLDVNSLLFGSGAELRLLLIQPSGDFELSDAKAGKAK